MRTVSSAHLGLALTLLLTGAPAAHADVIIVDVPSRQGSEADFQKARASSQDANEAFENGDLQGAEMHAQAAYRLYPNASTALLVATLYAETKRPKKGFEWLLRARNLKPDDAMREQLDGRLQTAASGLGLVVVEVAVEPSTAVVTIDGKSLGNTRFAGVSQGEHLFAATAEGYDAAQTKVTVSGPGMQTVRLALDKGGLQEGMSGLAIGGWTMVGVGIALVATGGVLTGLAVSDADALDPARPDYKASLDDATAQHDIGWALLGVGAAVAIGGVVLAVLGGSDGDGGDGAMAGTVSPLNGGGMVLVGGTF